MSHTQDEHLVPLYATSPEAVNFYNAALHELVGWYGNPVATIEKALEIDPNFAMGHIFRGVLEILGWASLRSTTLSKSIERARECCKHPRELKHLQALEARAKGHSRIATQMWEEILIDYPSDLFALKAAYDTYLFLGDSVNIRDSVSRVLRDWKENYSSSRSFSLVKGMYAFGLEETNFYREAELMACEALNEYPKDTWSVHTFAHICEMESEVKKGASFMLDKESDWKGAQTLSIHNYWHLCLFLMEMGKYDQVFELYDKKLRETHSGQVFNLIDASSLLFRLELAGQDVENRWDELLPLWTPHIGDNFLTFNDVHAMMCFVGGKDAKQAQRLVGEMKNFGEEWKHDPKMTESRVNLDVGIELGQIIQYWGEKNYQESVDKLIPLRFSIQSIGGSHAQRDIFNLLLLDSSIKAKKYSLASKLLSERMEMKHHKSPQAWRLYAQTLEGLGKFEASQMAYAKYQELLSSIQLNHVFF